MFKWFRRPPPAPPEPKLTLANDPSLPKLPEGPRVPATYRGAAMILTSEVEVITCEALQEAVRRRIPDIHLADKPPDEPVKRPTAFGCYPEPLQALKNGRTPIFCGVTYIPGLEHQRLTSQSFVTSSWWWPETREVVASAKAFAATAIMGDVDKTPPKDRILLELQLTAAALDVLKTAVAVVWPDANAMWKPDFFREELEKAKGDIPVELTVAVKFGRDTEKLHPDGTPKWFARTEGLNALGIMEAEWRGFDGDPAQLVPWLSAIGWYLATKGPIIADGDSMGPDGPESMMPVVIRHEPSTTVLGTQTYVIYPQRLS